MGIIACCLQSNEEHTRTITLSQANITLKENDFAHFPNIQRQSLIHWFTFSFSLRDNEHLDI